MRPSISATAWSKVTSARGTVSMVTIGAGTAPAAMTSRTCIISMVASRVVPDVSRPRALRVLHVTKRFWPYVGGVERYVLDLSRCQVRSGKDVRIVTIDHDVMAHDRASLVS